MTQLNTLPIEVQENVKKALKAYDTAYVIYEYGKYNVSVAIGLKAHYAEDHKFIGEYKAKEVFTAEERVLNCMESFHEYHISYKGKRDYKWLKTLTWEDKFKYDNDGNIVLA